MNKLPLWKLRAASWPPALALALLLSVLAYSSGHAQGEPGSVAADAQVDSIVDAFYLLQYDFRVAEARHTANAKMDSLRISDVVAQLSDAKKQRYKDMAVFGIAVVTAGLIFYLGGRAAQ